MRIPGYIWINPLVGTILGTTLGLFISLPIPQTNENILEESTSGLSEHQKVRREK